MRGQSRNQPVHQGGQRYQPYAHNSGGTIDQIAKGPKNKRKIKVSGKSNIKKVAGAICHCIRAGGNPPYIMCTGPLAINQAIKAISVARDFLQSGDYGEEKDLIVQPEFDGDSAQCLLKLRNARPVSDNMADVEMTVNKISDAYKVAGAIAGNARKGERRIGMTGIGPTAIFRIVESISISCRYLVDDNIDIKFTPKFTLVKKAGKDDMHGMRFVVLAKS